MKDSNSIGKLLKEILLRDRNLLVRSDELLGQLENRLSSQLIRDYQPLKKLIQQNVGQEILVADSRDSLYQGAFCQRLNRKLIDDGLREERARMVVDSIIYAMEWVVEEDVKCLEDKSALQEKVYDIGDKQSASENEFDIEDIFLERMTVMEPGRAIVGSLEITGADILAEDDTSIILPLNPKLLEVFSPCEIAERISLESREEDIFVNFLLPVKGTHGTNVNLRLTKKYPKEELVYLQTEVPNIEIWPNFSKKGWNRYYLYYENVAAQDDGSKELGKDFFYVEPWNPSGDVIENLPKHGLMNVFTSKMKSFPEVLLCRVYSTSDDGEGEILEAGFVLLNRPTTVKVKPGKTWITTIDFEYEILPSPYVKSIGGVCISYECPGYGLVQPLNLLPHLFQVTDSGVRRFSTFVNFVPCIMGENSSEVPAIYHMFNSVKSPCIRPLLDGNIFFLGEHLMGEFVRSKYIDTNLDWNEHETDPKLLHF